MATCHQSEMSTHNAHTCNKAADATSPTSSGTMSTLSLPPVCVCVCVRVYVCVCVRKFGTISTPSKPHARVLVFICLCVCVCVHVCV